MMLVAVTALLVASKSEVPPDAWVCSNDVEVWCTADSCSAKPGDETTPMSIAATRAGEISVCAYTGCWEGRATVSENNGRVTWAADELPFSSQPDGGFAADVSLLIVEKDAVGFVRVGGIASPLLCLRRGPDGLPVTR